MKPRNLGTYVPFPGNFPDMYITETQKTQKTDKKLRKQF